jgi:hypothetical protein
MRDEVIPLAVEQDAAEVEHAFGAIATPAHAGTVEPHAHEVSDGALDGAGGDVEIVGAQLVVAHAMAMLAQVLEDVEQLVAPQRRPVLQVTPHN